MEVNDSRRASALLRARIAVGSAPEAAASAVAGLLADIDEALVPIVGSHGVAALYKRSLYLAVQSHPELAGLHETVERSVDAAALRERLKTLSTEQATLAGTALIETFHDLLGSLVGSSLTERLLSSLWDRPLSDPPALEPNA